MNLIKKLVRLLLSKVVLFYRLVKNIETIECIEKNIVYNSNLFDYLYYNKTYGYNFSKFEAVEHWCKTWMIKNENPSQIINIEYCKDAFKYINPILCYMSKGKERVFFPDNKNNYKTEYDDKEIDVYINAKSCRKSKSVIYTCITNDYDDINEIKTYKYINKDWDYVCFTDNIDHIRMKNIGIWEIRPLEFYILDHTKNNRWHKIHPHILFPEYDESIYIDANINILTEYLFNIIKIKNKNIIIPDHFKNVCIYSEYNDIIETKRDNLALIFKELEFVKLQAMPKNYGMTENNIIYRKHHNMFIKKIMDDWWAMIEKYSKRDQLSFTYVLWKNNIEPKDITFENTRFLINDFYIWAHKK